MSALKGVFQLILLSLLGFILMSSGYTTPISCYTPFGQILGQAGKTIAYSNCHDDYVSHLDSYLVSPKGEKIFTGMKWQCVEYARRWLIENKGITFAEIEYAYQLWTITHATQLATHQPLQWQRYANKATNELPQAGDLLIYDQTIGDTGHVAVIVGVEEGSILIAEQNYFNLPWEAKQYARRLMLMRDEAKHFMVVDGGVIGWMRVMA